MVTYLQETFKVSERRACKVLAQNRKTQRYEPRRPDIDRPIIDRINALAEKHPRYGYRRIAALLRREGYHINIKLFICFGGMKTYKSLPQSHGKDLLEMLKMRVT